ncbi:polar amino acid transport system substrate-binding protein [Duganella sp. 1224]|uniref:substrate-binding periplasmic protein n=1 Tax=Duganella sp. 1224 TaxID=2587052 RepID=UPI0015C82D05|nr:transporter substrate-binding domain-containing protein [Duganella sp. 1224]NYE59932.1 polar amino acid transport system substrate-binding protein [Duganella sp. 1224]
MLAALVGLAAEAGAAPVTCPDRPLKVAMYQDGMLYSHGKGIDQDLLDELGRRTGCRFSTIVLPRVRAYVWLRTGEIDMVMSSLANDERSGYAWFFPYLQQKWMAVLAADAPATLTSAQFLAEDTLRFGAVRGLYHGERYEEWNSALARGGRLDLLADPSSLYDMLKYRRIAGFFAVPLQYERELRVRGMSAAVRTVDWFPAAPPIVGCIALSKKNFLPEESERWRATVISIRDDGTLLRILQRYVTTAEAKRAIAHPGARP